jgi:protocatechuate 3,4-dioxygenase, beta subunit
MKCFLSGLLPATILLGCIQTNSQGGAAAGQSARQNVGGSCEGCEVIYQSPTPFAQLHWVDTLPDWSEEGPNLIISGTVYKSDGKTPAPGVVLYFYHTDQNGRYTNRNNEQGMAGRHGYIKGWVKTNEKGQYKLYTLKPAPYPGASNAAHIHPVVKEPDKNEYYIDEYLFESDPFLTAEEKARQEGRGGNGIISLTEKNGMLYGERNIYLGKNIPGYPSGK